MARPTIGILAGMGPRSTAPFIDQVLTECQVQYGARNDIDFPKMMICSLPAPFYPDRPTDHAAMEATIRAGLQDLVRSGADFIAIPCNTAHIYYPQLAASIDLPVLNMVELALDALPKAAKSIALVAARPTIEAGVYQEGIRARGRNVVDIDWQGEVDALIGSTRTSRDPAVFRAQWAALMQRAAAARADSVIIACMDLTAIKTHIDTALHVLDAGQCLAAAIVKQWRAGHGSRAGNTAPDIRRGNFRVSTDARQLDVAAIHAYLTRSYWAAGISPERVALSLRDSLCFGLFEGNRQIGFARVVTDRTTFGYLCDVYVLEEYRGQGLGQWLVETVIAHPDLATIRRFVLATRDAHSLYAKFGFTPLQAPDRLMEILRTGIYASKS